MPTTRGDLDSFGDRGPLLRWLIFTGVCVFGFVLFWHYGLFRLMLSNEHFDPVAGSRLYNNYIEQYMLAEEVGVDGIMLNEHHNAPFCMQAKANIFAAILAGMTKKAKT